jgi:Icc-related predicted phosphoesterase
MRVVMISDTHGRHRELGEIPAGDLLIHGGDFTNMGEMDVLRDANAWLGELPHKHKVVIAGNHDFCFERQPDEARAAMTNATYLFDESVEIDGLLLYGSPWHPWFYDWAFGIERGAPLREKWDLIPAEVDILITHGPPHQIGDLTVNGDYAGCEELTLAIERIQPRLHVSGHIHEGYGVVVRGQTTYANASSCRIVDEGMNRPVVVDL